MSRAKAVQTSKDRLVANMIVTIPASVMLFMIWRFNKWREAQPPDPVNGASSADLPL